MTDARFGEIVAQYERLVYTICYQFTHDHHIAEDLTQETFVSAWRHRDTCPEDSMKPWLSRIAANKAKDHLKSAYNRRVMTPGEDGLPETQGNGVLFISDSRPEDIAISHEQVQLVENDIRALKEPYHQVAVLYFLEEQTVEEISKRLDRPPKTVHTQLFRAKKLLQQKLAPARGGAEEDPTTHLPKRQTKGGGQNGTVP